MNGRSSPIVPGFYDGYGNPDNPSHFRSSSASNMLQHGGVPRYIRRQRPESPRQHYQPHFMEATPNSITVSIPEQLTTPLSRFSYDSHLNRQDVTFDDRQSDYGYYPSGLDKHSFVNTTSNMDQFSPNSDVAVSLADNLLPTTQFRVFERPSRSTHRADSSYNTAQRRYRSLDRNNDLLTIGSARELNNYGFDYPDVVSKSKSRSSDRVDETPITSTTKQFTIGGLSNRSGSTQDGLEAINSIRTFWSPELKRERTKSKEQTARLSVTKDQLKQAEADLRNKNYTIDQLRSQLSLLQHRGKEMRMAVRNEPAELSPLEKADLEHLRRDKEKHAMEMLKMSKQVEDLELQIDSQKQTLHSREESIKKLITMKGMSTEEFDNLLQNEEAMRKSNFENERKARSLEGLLNSKDLEIEKLKENLSHTEVNLIRVETEFNDLRKDADTSGAMLQIIKETKDSRILQLEKELKRCNEKLSRLSEQENMTESRKEETEKHVNILRSRESLLKARMETMKSDLQRRETECIKLKETLQARESSISDQSKHIGVLKEQVSAKETQIDMLHNDLDALRDRIKERDSTFERNSTKMKDVQDENSEKSKELTGLKEQLDVKERKMDVLQRKMENLEDMFAEKDGQLNAMKTHLASLQADATSTDSTVQVMRDALDEKERMVDKLRQQREKADQIHRDECESLGSTLREFRFRAEQSQNELDRRQQDIYDLKDSIGRLESEKKRVDDVVKDLERQLKRKDDEAKQLRNELELIRSEGIPSEFRAQLEELDSENAALKDEMSQLHVEIDGLLSAFKELEEDRNRYEQSQVSLQKEIEKLQGSLSSSQKEVESEKKNIDVLKSQLAQGEDKFTNFHKTEDKLRALLKEREARVQELEGKILSNAKSIAELENNVEQNKNQLLSKDSEVVKLTSRLDELRLTHDECQTTIKDLKDEMDAKKKLVIELQSEKKRQSSTVFDARQEALLASLGEKDAHLSLLEMTTKGDFNDEQRAAFKRLNDEKLDIKDKLRQLNEDRMSHLQRQSTLPFSC